MVNRAGAAKPYALALLTVGFAIAVTRLSWPFFAATPFIPLYAAALVATHFGSGPAGLFALGLTIAAAPIAFPGTPLPVAPRAFGVYVLVGIVSNRVLVNRNRVEAALRSRDEELQAVWQHAGLGVALVDRHGHITRTNPAFERLFGAANAAAYLRTSLTAWSHADELDAERARFAHLMTSHAAAYQSEHRFQRHDGTAFWGRVTVSKIRDRAGLPTGAMAILENVTERHQAEHDLRVSEERLRRAQKLEAIGRLVAGVAHNFNNLLTVTRGYAELLLERRADPNQDRADLEEIRKAADRGATLARQLLTFGRRHDNRARHIDLNRVVGDLRGMLARVIREDIRLTIQPAACPATVLADPDDVEQMVLNLVLNARDALPMGGAIAIALDVGHYPIDTGHASEAPREVVRLRVCDTGMGMTPEVRAHLFEPFFTTKDVGQGTGLGLAFVDGLVRHHHGAIDVDSAPEHGTTFTIYLPFAIEAPALERATSLAPAPSVVRSGATILLVEDELPVRTLTERMLERVGYRVLSAASPADACALFEAHAADVTLLVTDVVMPEMHGSALAQRLVAQRPDLRVLFMSGYSDAIPEGTGTRRTAFLQKPFVAAHLVSAVETLLQATA